MDLRPPIGVALDAFGVDATVTPPGAPAVPTRAFWLPSVTAENPIGSDYRRAEQRRVLVVPSAGLASFPRGTIVNMPEADGLAAANWKVDDFEKLDHDHYRAVVVPA